MTRAKEATATEVRPPAVGTPRLYWRAVVKGDRKLGDGHLDAGLAWHLAHCVELSGADGHCPEGQRLLKAQGNPDGHCLNDGVCLRCQTAAPPPEREADPQPA